VLSEILSDLRGIARPCWPSMTPIDVFLPISMVCCWVLTTLLAWRTPWTAARS